MKFMTISCHLLAQLHACKCQEHQGNYKLYWGTGMENALVLQAPAMEEAAKASGVYRKQAVLEQWCKEGKLKVEELARAEAKKAENGS